MKQAQAKSGSENAVFETYLKSYAITKASEVSKTPKINFVSTDVAFGFFEEGIKLGEREFKKRLAEKVQAKITKQIESTFDITKQLASVFKEKNYIANKLFIAINLGSSKILYSVPEDQHYKEDFMNLFYSLASELETSYSNEDFHLSISAIDESENINVNLLKSDGYTFGFDLINEKKLF
jgi:hypothetical protein